MKKNASIIITLLLSVAFFLGLTACSEEQRELTFYEPGEYKGEIDPLLAAGQHPELNHRLKEIQADR